MSDENQTPSETPEVPAVVPEEEVKKLEQQVAEFKDRLLRTAAEFENFKKRAKKEMDEAGARGRDALVKELLPAIDNLERALSHAKPDDPLAAGVSMVEKQLMSILEKFGVSRFSALGQPFDPNLHDAIQQVETSEVPSGSVAQEFARGYMQGQRLLRPAMVAVAKAPAPSEPPSGGNGEAKEGG